MKQIFLMFQHLMLMVQRSILFPLRPSAHLKLSASWDVSPLQRGPWPFKGCCRAVLSWCRGGGSKTVREWLKNRDKLVLCGSMWSRSSPFVVPVLFGTLSATRLMWCNRIECLLTFFLLWIAGADVRNCLSSEWSMKLCRKYHNQKSCIEVFPFILQQ